MVKYLEDKNLFDEVTLVEKFLGSNDKKGIAENFAKCQVKNPSTPDVNHEVSGADVRLEKKLLNRGEQMTGIFYDGFKLMDAFYSLIPEKEGDYSFIHTVYTDRFFGT